VTIQAISSYQSPDLTECPYPDIYRDASWWNKALIAELFNRGVLTMSGGSVVAWCNQMNEYMPNQAWMRESAAYAGRREHSTLVRRYSEFGEFAGWNAMMRDHPNDDTRWAPEVRRLNEILANSPPTVDEFYVFRGTNSTSFINFGAAVYKNSGFFSTSFSVNKALEFMTDDGVLMALKIPRGARGLVLGMVADILEEMEFLFPHGTTFVRTSAIRTSLFYDVSRDQTRVFRVYSATLNAQPDRVVIPISY
jgi:hypothetical protein